MGLISFIQSLNARSSQGIHPPPTGLTADTIEFMADTIVITADNG
jgi:hypothetical protein